MDNMKNIGDNMQLGINNSHLNPFNYRKMTNKKKIQTIFHSITISQPFDSYPGDPATNYVGVLVLFH